MKRDFLGRGWKFPVALDDQEKISLCADEEKIKESISIILGTAKGERVMRPEFGCDIHNYVFTSISTSSLTLIKSAVKEALVLWEPRIEVLDIVATLDDLSEGTLAIRIHYRIRKTNSEFSLVYPFFLKPGGE